MEEKYIKRFWSKVDVQGKDDCWNWLDSLTSEGYGRMNINKIFKYAHRISYFLHFGDFPSELCVCHKCDNTQCCNPNHLFLGTHQDNMKDRNKKGRGNNAKGDKTGARIHPEKISKGENHYKSKLSIEDVREIIRLATNKIMSRKDIAKKFNISVSNTNTIILRKTWKSID